MHSSTHHTWCTGTWGSCVQCTIHTVPPNRLPIHGTVREWTSNIPCIPVPVHIEVVRNWRKTRTHDVSWVLKYRYQRNAWLPLCAWKVRLASTSEIYFCEKPRRNCDIFASNVSLPEEVDLTWTAQLHPRLWHFIFLSSLLNVVIGH